MNENKKIDYEAILNTLQLNWIATFAAPTAVVILSLWVSPVWLPFIALACVPLLVGYGYYISQKSISACTLTRRYTEYALIVAAFIMIIINLAETRWGQQILGLHSRGDRVPYVPAVIIYPILALFKLLQCFRLRKTEYCRACLALSKNSPRLMNIRAIYDQQVHFLSKFSLLVALIITVIVLPYYYLYYIDININVPDKFFFVFVPIAMFVLATAYVVVRYNNMKFEVATIGIFRRVQDKSEARFIVIRGDEMRLQSMEIPGLEELEQWETPAIHVMPNTENFSDEEAEEAFRALNGPGSFTLKRLYRTVDPYTGTIIFHFAAFLPADASTKLPGIWMKLNEIDKLYNSNRLTQELSTEIHRIFVITMAWKTYTREGRRLYPIKNYRPTFRLSDFKDWDVDYNDLHWVNIFKNNEDKPFWRLRNIWRKYFTGVDSKWNG